MAPKLPTGGFVQLPLAGKILLLVLALGVLTAGYYVGFHMGLEDDTSQAKRRYEALGQQLTEAKNRQKEYLKLREEVTAREALDRQNLRILPVDAEIAAFLDDLNRLAELSGLQTQSVQPSPESAEQFFIKVPVALVIRGKYHELAKFFYNISRLERAINMEDIHMLIAEKQGDGEAQLAVNVRATTFRRKP